MDSLHPYLVDQRIKELQRQKKELKEKYHIKKNDSNTSSRTAVPMDRAITRDSNRRYRKNAISLILALYLINIKKLYYDDAFNTIKDWLYKCDSIKRLDFNFNYRINYALENSIKKGYLPMKFETLKQKNRALYDSLNIDKQ